MAFGRNTNFMMSDYSYKNILDISDEDKISKAYGLFRDTFYTITNFHASEEEKQLYKVFGEGFSYEVTADHVLNLMCGKAGLKDTLGNEMSQHKIFNITVDEYLKSDEEFRQNVYVYKLPLNWMSHKEEFEPYDYGVMLSHDRFMNRLQDKLGYPIYSIPNTYLINDENTRLEFLAGYVDGCGEYENNKIRLNIKDKRLTDDILFLAQSLGLVCIQSDDSILIGGNLSKLPSHIFDFSDADCMMLDFDIVENGMDIVYSFDVKETGSHLIYLDDFSIVHV